MVNVGAIRTAIGIIGNVISFGLFMSPVPTFIAIWKAKSVQDFRPDPYIATILNCAMWTFYGMPFVSEDNVLVITINAFGFFLEIFYTLIFFIYSTWSKRKKILLVVLAELIFIALVVFLVMTFVHSQKQREVIVGPICIVFNILMYCSPLTVMYPISVLVYNKYTYFFSLSVLLFNFALCFFFNFDPNKKEQRQVIKSKSVKYMPFLLSLTNFFNGAVWTTYAVLKWDLFVMIPNSLGTLSGLTQLILYAVYYRTTNWEPTPSRYQQVTAQENKVYLGYFSLVVKS
ncbi:Bidirectional sugar transporter SWEET5, partial [Mucuna pruriens]